MSIPSLFVCHSIPGTTLALCLRSSMCESPHRRLGLLFFRSPSSLPVLNVETCGPPKFPSYPFECMPCSFRTAVFQLSETVDFPSNALKVILLTTMSTISGLTNTAYILATPSSAPPLARTHAGSLPTCWLSFGRMGLEVFRLSPIG